MLDDLRLQAATSGVDYGVREPCSRFWNREPAPTRASDKSKLTRHPTRGILAQAGIIPA
jgi:hypothetical protein